MKLRIYTAIWVFFLLFGIRLSAESQQYIITDAAGGIFNTDQKLTFSAESRGWLRLLLDNREIYRGRGPAFPELGVPRGEERGFTLLAEYYSPENAILESRSWYIYIDKNPPHINELEIRDTRDGPRLAVSGLKPDASLRAWADIDGELVFFQDLAGANPLPLDSFPAVVWAEDRAGNCSEPRAVYLEVSRVRIDNPVPGEWNNTQTLIISGAEGKEIFWTTDGKHPLEQGADRQLYGGPVRIEKQGRITLRIAWRESSGRIREESTVYSVIGNGRGSFEDSLAPFRRAEEKEIRSFTSFTVPEGCLWAVGGIPRNKDSGRISLRPQPLLKRTAAVHLFRDGTGIYRFAYVLDGYGYGGRTAELIPPARPLAQESLLYPDSIDSSFVSSGDLYSSARESESPKLVSIGRSRVIAWPEIHGKLHFSFGSTGPVNRDIWQEGNLPFPVPSEGGLLRWFIMDETESPVFSGPYSVNVPSLIQSGDPSEAIKGRIACRNYSPDNSSLWSYASEPLDYSRGILTLREIDICDDEDLEWAFISRGGKILETARLDRRAPDAPLLDSPPEGGWTRGPLRVSVIPGEKDTAAFLNARLRYASGETEILSGRDFLDIRSSLGQTADVTVEGYLVDSSGNQGNRTVRNFTLDPNTVHVSDGPLIAGNASVPKGGMDNPFTSLEEALVYAEKNNLDRIRIAGTQVLSRSIAVTHNISINGVREINTAAIIMENDSSWNINPGKSLSFSGIRLEKNSGVTPLIQIAQDGRADITGSLIVSSAPVLLANKSFSKINDTQMRITISGEQRTAALSSQDGVMEIDGSQVYLDGNYSLLFSLLGGSISAGNSYFSITGRRTASGFNLNSARGNFSDLSIQAAARDYASIMETADSDFILSKAAFKISARSCTAILLDNSAALIHDSQIRLEAGFSAKAVEIKGTTPVVRDSVFIFEGEAKRSEVFSGTFHRDQADFSGNRYAGFSHVWGQTGNLP